MPKPRINLSRSGMNAVMSAGDVAAALRAEAEKKAARARASAPVESGEYRESIKAETTTTAALGISFKSGGSRAAAVVVAHAPHSAGVEGRTGNLKRAMGG